jgi:hypothetical protein
MAQINNSQPGPVYTFTVNLETQQYSSWDHPNNRLQTPIGNSGGTYVEVDDQKFHRTIWLPGAMPGQSFSRLEPHAGEGTVTNANGTQVNIPGTSLKDGYYRHGDTIVAFGHQGVYLKNLYVSNPPDPVRDTLILVSVQ